MSDLKWPKTASDHDFGIKELTDDQLTRVSGGADTNVGQVCTIEKDDLVVCRPGSPQKQ